MLNRNIKVTIRLNRLENDRLKKMVKKSGLSQEAYIRHLLDGLIPTDLPPPDYYSMMRELHAIGRNLNQIAQKAHVLNAIDIKRYAENAALLRKAIVDISNAVMLPRTLGRRPD